MVFFRSPVFLLIFYLLDISVYERGMLTSVTVSGLTYPFIVPSFTYIFILLLLGAFRIIMCSWKIDPFIVILHPSLFQIIFLVLNSALSQFNFFNLTSLDFVCLFACVVMINIVYIDIYPPFTFNHSESLHFKYFLINSLYLGLLFLIHSDNVYFTNSVFRPLISK